MAARQRYVVYSDVMKPADAERAARAASAAGVMVIDSAHGALRVQASLQRVRRLVEDLGGTWRWVKETHVVGIPERDMHLRRARKRVA
jgi:hypothetical protein